MQPLLKSVSLVPGGCRRVLWQVFGLLLETPVNRKLHAQEHQHHETGMRRPIRHHFQTNDLGKQSKPRNSQIQNLGLSLMTKRFQIPNEILASDLAVFTMIDRVSSEHCKYRLSALPPKAPKPSTDHLVCSKQLGFDDSERLSKRTVSWSSFRKTPNSRPLHCSSR